MKANCKVCGDEFEAKPNHVRSARAKCCSRKCGGIGRRRTETRPCSQCGTPITRKPCEFDADFCYCDSTCCNKHAASMARPSVRIEEEFVYIPLSQGQWARVDRVDYESIPMLRDEIWTAVWNETSQTFYALRRENRIGVFMHRVVTGAPDGMDVNHRDHNGLNNSRINLDVCTRSQNIQYRRKPRQANGKPTTSRYKGVYLFRRTGKWKASIDNFHIGYFDDEREAAEAYNRKAAALFGHFAILNVVEDISEDI